MNINILDMGAVADGIHLNTVPIQTAIDTVHQSGGGRVCIPQGVFISGTLRLKSNVELHLEQGAVLKASTNMDDYNPDNEYPENWESKSERWRAKHLILCVRQTNVAITGTGVIDGSGDFFFEEDKPFPPTNYYSWMYGCFSVKDPEILRPGQLLAVIDSQQIKIRDVTFVNATCWTVYLHGCRYADISGIRISNPVCHENTDGIDIDTCEYVTVSNCIIKTGDDCITLRCDARRLTNGMDTCKHIAITNCVLECSVCAFRIGVGHGRIRNAVISNITVSRGGPVLYFMTSYLGKGEAFIENINISNITAENTGNCIKIQTGDRGYVRDISVSNFRAHCFSSVYINADIPGLISGIHFSNLHLISEIPDYPVGDQEHISRGDHLIRIRNAANVTFTDAVAEIRQDFPGRWKGLAYFDHCESVRISGGNLA